MTRKVWTADNQVAGEIREVADGFGAYVSGVLIETCETRHQAAHAVLGAHHALQWPISPAVEPRPSVGTIWPLR